MKLLTERVLIREVAQRWKAQYAGYRSRDPKDTEEKQAIGRKLAKLDGETATAADVAAIIGNDSWTRIDHCDECGAENIPAAVRFAEDSDSSAADICLPCLRKAVRLASGVGSPRGVPPSDGGQPAEFAEATTAELAQVFGASPAEAVAIQAGAERAAGAKLKVISPKEPE